MTRDEAIKVFAMSVHKPQREYFDECKERIAEIVDGMVAVGVLKLDADLVQARHQERVMKEFRDIGLSFNEDLLGLALKRAGLQIVER